jgi:RimJ/RimL family protein N-acetyltransferase
MNQDPRVMKFFPRTLTAEESDRFYDTILEEFEKEGCGLFAVETKEQNEFIGFIGFHTEDCRFPGPKLFHRNRRIRHRRLGRREKAGGCGCVPQRRLGRTSDNTHAQQRVRSVENVAAPGR